MKKEKTIRTYQRRTKTGKVVTVKQHTAKYDAAEALKEAAKKKGAGDELENLKKKVKPEKVKVEKPAEDTPDYGFTADEFKAWYHWDQDADPKNKSALKVEKALKKQMGTKAYNKYFDELTDSYSSRGHNKAFKGLGEKLSTGEKKPVTSGKEKTKKEVDSDAKVSKEDAAKLKKAEKRQSDYVKHLMRLHKDGVKDKQMGGYIAAEKQILEDLKKHKGSLKSDGELSDTEESYAKKNKLRYEEDGMYSSKDGKIYRISVHPITGAAKAYPLTGNTMGANKAQLRAAGLKGDDYDTVDYDKLSDIIWGSKGKKSVTPSKEKAAIKSKVREDLPSMKHGGDVEKDAYSHKVATSKLQKEGFKLGKDNLFHHEDGRTAYIDTKSGKWMIKEAKSSKESKAGKGPVGSEYEGPATLQTYKGDLSKASVRKMEGGKGYHITSPEGYSLARFSTKAAADKALASRTFDDKHSAKVEEWKQNGNVRGLQKEIAKIKLQYGNDRKKAAKLIKPLEEAIAAAKSSSKKETGKDYSAKVKEAHAALKEKGYKRYIYNGEVYYATKSGSLKQVDSDGRVRNVVPFKGARGTQESALKGWKRRDAEKAKAKRDKADAKKYREGLKSKGSK